MNDSGKKKCFEGEKKQHLKALAMVIIDSLNFQKIKYSGQNPVTFIGPVTDRGP